MSNEDEIGEIERPTIDERLEELRREGFSNKEIVIILYNEGYSTKDIMERRLPLKALADKEKSDESVMGALAGTAKGSGYLDEFKTMIRVQISRSRELTDLFNSIGMGTLLASLRKSGISVDQFRAIALKGEGIRDALMEAGETAFKALEYYDSDLVKTVELERDDARSYAVYLESKIEELVKHLDPRVRLERMIQTYLLSGGAEPSVLMSLIDKWLGMEMADLRLELIR